MPHDLLIFKLQKYGFPSFLIAWVRSWLHGRTSVVTVYGKTSKPFQTTSGVPQGSVLGPLLFIVYINDLPEVVKHSDCRLYADDTILAHTVESPQDIGKLQEDIDSLLRWSESWKMQFKRVQVRAYSSWDTDACM